MVWRCVFVWFWGVFLMVVYCCGSGCVGCICVVLRLVLMVVCRCGSGGLGCIWRHLSWSLPWRCNFFFSSLRASESDVRHFSWVVWRCVFVWFWGVLWWWFTVAEAAALDAFAWFWGLFWWWCAVAEAAAWDASGGISPGRCLGGVTSSFLFSSLRASESDVRHFSWVVWRCVFVWFWGRDIHIDMFDALLTMKSKLQTPVCQTCSYHWPRLSFCINQDRGRRHGR